MPEGRREHKDRLFCDLFSEKENALSLYNAVSGTNYTDIEELEIITLKDVLYLTMKNDVALCFHDEMTLFEHQSSVNPNMPLRGLLYFAREYEGWLAKREIDIYSSTLVKIPAPRYYVLYNGKTEQPEYQVLRLSDAFARASEGMGPDAFARASEGMGQPKGKGSAERTEISKEYEWTAHVFNINIGHNQELMGKCPALFGYATLIQLIRDYQAAGSNLEEAIAKATDDCIAQDLLREYLLRNKGEVRDMILTEYNEELREKTLKEEGRAEGFIDALISLVKDGILSVKDAATRAGVTEAVFRQRMAAK